MNTTRERVVRVIGPIRTGADQSRAQRIYRARSTLVDRPLDAFPDLARVRGALTREKPDDRIDQRLAAASNLGLH